MKSPVLMFINFLLVLGMAENCTAKDSTLVFKISAGINYSLPDEPEPYNHPWFSHGGNGYERLTNSPDNTGFSPIIKAGGHKMFGKHTGILVQAAYYYSRLDYTKTINYRSYTPVSPTVITITQTNSVTGTRIHRNHFNLALGPVFYFSHFYISPKIDAAVTLDIIKADSTYQEFITPPNTSESNNFKSKTRDENFMMAAGLLAGYDFKIGKQILFIELQSDYDLSFSSGPRAYHQLPSVSFESTLSNFKTALTIGIGF